MKIFLSHASNDNALAKRVYHWLRNQPVSVWIDDVELRPGDKLDEKITFAIHEADFLLVLVTENSKKRRWVKKEIKIGRKREGVSSEFKVIPILLEGCSLPSIFKGLTYVRITDHDSAFPEIISAVFRDSYIMELTLRPDNLELDETDLMDHLDEYVRSRYEKIWVYVNNQDFNRKVNQIMEASISAKTNTNNEEIRALKIWYQKDLYLYWTNLSQLLTQLINNIFHAVKKNSTTLHFAFYSINNTVKYCHYALSSHLREFPTFADYAKKVRIQGIKNFVTKFENYEHGRNDNDKRVLAQIYNCSTNNLAFLILTSKNPKINGIKIYCPNVSKQMLHPQIAHPLSELIQENSWYTYCIPQLISRFLIESVYERKPIHELNYDFGLKIDDYDKVYAYYENQL